MSYLMEKLLKEALKTLDICQAGYFSGKIELEVYYTLTKTKIDFIDNLLKEEKSRMFIDKDMRKLINKVYINDFSIRFSTLKAAPR